MDRRLEKLQEEIASALHGMTPEQLRRHAPGKWSSAEVLEHLYLTYTGTIKGFERAAAGRRFPSKPTWRQRARRFVVLSLGHMPRGREAPANTRPRGLALEKVVIEVGMKIAEMDEMIAGCEATLGRGRLLDHPILGPLTAAQWRKFHLVHGLHHVKQIRRLRGFWQENDLQ
jgi:Protein of unknown function (DUF1569)